MVTGESDMGAFYSRAAYRVAEAHAETPKAASANFFDLRIEETMILLGLAGCIAYCSLFYAAIYYGTTPAWYPIKLILSYSWDVAVGIYVVIMVIETINKSAR